MYSEQVVVHAYILGTDSCTVIWHESGFTQPRNQVDESKGLEDSESKLSE